MTSNNAARRVLAVRASARGNGPRARIAGAILAALLTTVVCAVAPNIALGNKRPLTGAAAPAVTPLSMENYVTLYVADTINYGQSFASGAMGLIEHLDTTTHSVKAIAPCNNLSGNKANDVRFALDNMTGDYEITCPNGDLPAEHPFAPHSKYCVDPDEQPNCEDMNLGTAQEYVASKVESYIESLNPEYANDSYGNVTKMAIDNYNSKRETDLHLYLKPVEASAGETGRSVKEMSLYTDKGKETFAVEFYPSSS